MSTSPRTLKRLRDEPAGAISAASHRSALASRVGNATPHFWLHAAKSAGTSGADAFLVHLGQSIAVSMQFAAELAESARVQLHHTRAALHAAIDVRCDELGASIDSIDVSKTASLELQLVAVDAGGQSPAMCAWRSLRYPTTSS